MSCFVVRFLDINPVCARALYECLMSDVRALCDKIQLRQVEALVIIVSQLFSVESVQAGQ